MRQLDISTTVKTPSTTTTEVKYIPSDETLKRLILPPQQQQTANTTNVIDFDKMTHPPATDASEETKGNAEDALITPLKNNNACDVIDSSDRVSPRSSRSSSLNSTTDTNAKSTSQPPVSRHGSSGSAVGPGYERNLLKKKVLVPEISFDDCSAASQAADVTDVEVCFDDEARARILDYKSDVEHRGALNGGRVRKHSFNEKLRHLVDPSHNLNSPSSKDRATEAVKKFIKSPGILRKSPSFSRTTAVTTDSCVSSCPDENEETLGAGNNCTEKRKKRKISMGKRSRKTSKGQQHQQQAHHVDDSHEETSTTVVDKHNKKDEKKKANQQQQQQQQQQELHSRPHTRFRRRKWHKAQNQTANIKNKGDSTGGPKMILIYSGGDIAATQQQPIKNQLSSSLSPPPPANQVDSTSQPIKSENSSLSTNQNIANPSPNKYGTPQQPPATSALSSIKTAVHKSSRLQKLKGESTAGEDSVESSSEYDEYSSAMSDADPVLPVIRYDNDELNSGSGTETVKTSSSNNKMRRGIAKRVWKSINTLLFEANNDPAVVLKGGVLSASPLSRLRHDALQAAATFKHTNSMPSGLDRVDARENIARRRNQNQNRVVRKPLFLLKNYENNSISNTTQDDMKLSSPAARKDSGKTQNDSVDFNGKLNGGTFNGLLTVTNNEFSSSFQTPPMSPSRHRRSKSLDFLLDHTMVQQSGDGAGFEGGCLSPPADLFGSGGTENIHTGRKKAHSTLTAREHDMKMAKTSSHHNTKQHQQQQYKVVVAHAPKPPKPPPQEHSSISKSSTSDTSSKSSKKKTGHHTSLFTSSRRKDNIRVRLQDMKGSSQQELESFLSDKQFQPGKVKDWCRVLSESVKSRVVHITGDAYKVVVQVFIGALCEDGIHAAIQCNNTLTASSSSSDKHDTDQGLFTVTYKGDDLFAVVSVLNFELPPL